MLKKKPLKKNQLIVIDFEYLAPGTVIENQYTGLGLVFMGDEIANEQIVIDKVGVGYDSLEGNIIQEIKGYKEILGEGIKGIVNGHKILIGSRNFVSTENALFEISNFLTTKVFVSIDEELRGNFNIVNTYRSGLKNIVSALKSKFTLAVVSGDNDGEKAELQKIFPTESEMLFNQSPYDKLSYIKQLQENSNSVLMIGDGLNDALNPTLKER